MPAIHAVVFDLGNVLVEWHPERTFDALIGAERRAALFGAVDLYAMNERVDLGADMTQEVQALAAAHPDWHDEILLWDKHWPDMLRPDIPDTAVLLRALRKRGVAVHALTNFGDGTLDIADGIYPVLGEFDQRFVSGRLGLMKPDPAIYAHVETATGLAPDSLLFTDDRPENIDAASARGWQVHLFEGPDGFRDRLLDEGLLDASDLGR